MNPHCPYQVIYFSWFSQVRYTPRPHTSWILFLDLPTFFLYLALSRQALSNVRQVRYASINYQVGYHPRPYQAQNSLWPVQVRYQLWLYRVMNPHCPYQVTYFSWFSQVRYTPRPHTIWILFLDLPTFFLYLALSR